MILQKIIFPIIESCIRNISGGLGQRIRYQYYKRRFKSCGKNVKKKDYPLIDSQSIYLFKAKSEDKTVAGKEKFNLKK